MVQEAAERPAWADLGGLWRSFTQAEPGGGGRAADPAGRGPNLLLAAPPSSRDGGLPGPGGRGPRAGFQSGWSLGPKNV